MLRSAWLLLLASCAASAPPVQAPPAAPPAPAPAPVTTAPPPPDDTEFLKLLADTRRFSLGTPTRIEVVPDGSQVLFLRSGARAASSNLYAFDVASGQTRELLTAAKLLGGAKEKLGPEERARRERMRISGGGIANYALAPDGKHVLVESGGKAFVAPLDGGAAVEVAGPDADKKPLFDARFAPDGKSIAFVRAGELWVAPVTGGAARQITRGATADVTHAQAEFAAEEELDRFAGYWWSPDAAALLYEIADATKVEKYYGADAADPMTPAPPPPYPRPGHPNVDVSLALAPLRGGKPVTLAWDRAKYSYLVDVTWPEKGPLTLTVMTRDQRDLELLAVDEKSGATRPLLHEHDDAWVDVRTSRGGGRGEQYRWLRDGSGFLWTTDRNGATQLELHAPDGKLVRALTAPGFGFRAVRHVDLAKRELVLEAAPEPVDGQLWSVSLDGGDPKPLSPAGVVTNGIFARDGGTVVLMRASEGAEFPLEVHRADGSVAGVLESLAEKAPFEPKAEIVKLGSAPGFWTSIVRPRDFDAKRKYPVVVYVYGGPGVRVVNRNRHGFVFDQFLADHGFIVVSIDNRGSPQRDRTWERAIQNKLAEVPLADQVAGLKLAGEHEPAMDLGRVGIYGGSYGGFMTVLAVERRPDVYKAGVAVAPVTDWLDYDTAYTERYLGVPDLAADTTVYDENSLLKGAAKLERPLLLLHGTADDNVHVEHSLKLVDALFRAGRPVELVTVSGQAHGIREPHLVARYLALLIRFFEKNL